jgi:uncharacterized protein (DUF1501 family)
MTHSRREFLKATLRASTLAALAPTVPDFLCRAAVAAGPRRRGDAGNVLVVVQLTGGNDGLNCVVPYADDEYAKRRNTLRLTRREVHPINDFVGFHPDMVECRRLYDEGLFSVVQGVGYPKSSRNHQAAAHDWQTARPGESLCPTGWVGRFVDEVAESEPFVTPAAFVSTASRPFALNASKGIIPTIPSLEQAPLQAAQLDTQHTHRLTQLARREREAENPMLEHVRTGMLTAWSQSERLREAAIARETGTYPSFPLAARLRMIAGLIRAETGFRIFFTELGGDGFGGFDNHAGQKENHAALLRQFSRAIAAFMDDLKRDRLSERVVLMTVSEFGRTVTENGRRGTGHGAAAPVFLAGGKIRGGLIGDHPKLDDLDQDALRFQVDFRSVYAAMLDRWLGCDSVAVLGESFPIAEVFGRG